MSEARTPPRYDWNDIVYFLAVARHKNLGRAAKALKVDLGFLQKVITKDGAFLRGERSAQ